MLATLLAVARNADDSIYVAQNVAFGIIAAMMVFSAIRVVTTDNVVHAAFYLVMVLAGVAAQFILLGAEFLAITQVLVYIGAIVVLFLFGVMLTKAPMEGQEKVGRDNWALGALTSIVLLGLMGYVLIEGFGRDKLPQGLVPTSTAAVSDSIFGEYLIPFEVVSVLLLSALIGAIVIARKD